jgi:hypothetical protein
VLDLHGLDVHDLVAFLALGEDAPSSFSSYLEVLSFAAGAGEFPVVIVFFGCHLYQHISIVFWVLNGNIARRRLLNESNAEDGN